MTDKTHPLVISDGNFEAEILKSSLPALVDFWAPWCGPCKALAPILEDLAQSYQDRVKIGKLNVDDNPQSAATYGVRSIPTLILFKDGAVVDTLVGLVSRERLEGFIKKAL